MYEYLPEFLFLLLHKVFIVGVNRIDGIKFYLLLSLPKHHSIILLLLLKGIENH